MTQADEGCDFYRNKVILAPMVRVGSLPLRMMALEYGADIVYTPEMVDKRVIGSTRVFNEVTGTIDYFKNGKINFQLHPEEKPKLVFQLGTADPDLALEAIRVVAQDISAVDVNCGCPKHFSISGGMGAALMSNPEKLCRILRNLVENSGLPVTCKIRIFPSKEDTVNLAKLLATTGIKAIGVHCRTKDERPREPGHWDYFTDIVKALDIPVIANGDVFKYEDIARVKEMTNVSSVMIARGAQNNVSIFRKEGLLPIREVMIQYIKNAIKIDNVFANTKYTLMQMLAEDTKSDEFKGLQKSKTHEQLCKEFGIEEFYTQTTEEMRQRAIQLGLDKTEDAVAKPQAEKKRKNSDAGSTPNKKV
ncbi:FMN-linked oxidoreductase [Basidiobolus meristosporus CBS 931.73]|uniref:tRNA-dihydrouridine synthase n=1 Tax=Basidiobolus meristosporus CBS 931.73 TaxID=1314790 RepID=A0A1Y1XT81_9FUNG|nr:FMN-linked oxidoreductase [Basidiobolus meristosporus CBS 931.73]|eukprot:ORX88967.1 FMN-linked oxidoreductase [Basidiobolus meristosporus CBS 931.73]